MASCIFKHRLKSLKNYYICMGLNNIKDKKYISKFVVYKHDYIRKLASKFQACKILDVGCGKGEYTDYFALENEVIGLDVNDYRIGKESLKFEFIQYDGKTFPFTDNTFDVVISWDVIEHIEADQSFVTEIRRVLKPGGRCICGTPNRDRVANMLRKLLLNPVKYPLIIEKNSDLGDVIHVREYTESLLANVFKNASFQKIRTEKLGFGIRGKIDWFVKKPIIKRFAQYLVCFAEK